jgi:hypothetical protein
MLALLGVLLRLQPMFGGEDPVTGDPWHHADMTWKAASRAGWAAGADDTDDTTAAAALAWHADFVDSYLYNPLWWAAGGLTRFRASLVHHDDLVNLHFDDLTSTRQVQLMWRRYQAGTVAGLLWAAERGDVGTARNVVGAGLHALQDFYSHSNWVDDPVRRGTTWPAAGPSPGAGADPRDAMHLYTGAYEQPVQTAFKPHGKYGFDCTLLRRLVPAQLMDAICAGISPLSNGAMCRRWQECKGAVSPRPTTIAGIPVPPDVLYVAPPGIALDSTWLAQIGVQQRDLPDRGGLSDPGKTLFEAAVRLATEHSYAWLRQLEDVMGRAGLGSFWDRVKSEPRTGQRHIPGPPELASMIGAYDGDLLQYEELWRAPFSFLSAGKAPPATSGSDDGWFLRLDITTAAEALAGTDADIIAVVDGRRFLLDRMHGRTPNGGLGELRILEHNDFEAGAKDTYVVGPFPARPQQLVLRNSAATGIDLVRGAWTDLVAFVSTVITSIGDFLLSLVAGHADLVGSDKQTWSWDDLARTAQAGGTPLTLRIRGGDEGAYDIQGRVTASPTQTGLRVTVSAQTLVCVKESTWDRFTTADEPFAVLLVISPAAAQTVAGRSAPFVDVDTGESRALGNQFVVDVPRYGGLIVAAQVWESDDEGPGDRDRLRDDFARGFDQRTINQRSAFLDALGRAVAPDWKLGRLDAYAFSRGPVVEVAHLVTDRPVGRWVEAGSSLGVPFDPVATRSVAIGSDTPLAAPVLVAPADGQRLSGLPRTTTLSWQAVPGATSYRVEVEYAWPSTSGTAWAPQLTRDTASTSLTFDFVGSQPGRWRVAALDQGGTNASSEPSPWWGFDYSPGVPLAVPEPTDPPEGQRYSHFPRTTTLSWQAVGGATGYQVEVEYGNRLGEEIVWTPWLSQAVTGGSWTFDFVGSQPGRWRVLAFDATGANASSSPSAWRSFDYSEAPPLATPVLRSPPDGQRYDHFPRTTTLVWAPVDGATGYRVEVEFGNATPTGMAWTPWRREEVAVPTLVFDFVGDQPGRWRVAAVDGGGSHAPSPPTTWRTFDYGTTPVLAVPVPLAPPDGERYSHFPRTTTVSWEPVTGATAYHVEVAFAWEDPAGGTTWEPWLTRDLEATSLTFEFVGAQPGRWRVSSTDPSGALLASAPTDWRTFSYAI